MPVRKLRSIEDATPAPSEPLRADNLRSAFELAAWCRTLRLWSPPHGVHRNASLSDAQARREAWERNTDHGEDPHRAARVTPDG